MFMTMDAARIARSGAEEVYMLYRKGFENMHAKVELQEADDDIKFELFKHQLDN